MDHDIRSLYLHLPFCERICAYCDFPKVLTHSLSQEAYFRALFNEISTIHIPDDSLKTIYIGGGTPTEAKTPLLAELLSYLRLHFPSVKEFTVEANPESLTSEKIRLCQEYGVNRISLGAQSADDDMLKRLNRNHSVKDIQDAVNRLQENGFENYSLDFIYGLPSMTIQDLDRDLDFAFSLFPKHLSFYALQIEEGTLFGVKKTKGESDDMMALEYQHLLSRLEERGFLRYEVSNFAKPGYESLHNLTYWHDEPYYACGLGAASYANHVRKINTKSITDYIQCKNNYTSEKISKNMEEFEFLMLNLRLVKGFSLSEFEARFHHPFLSGYFDRIGSVKDKVEISDGCFRIKKEYLYIMDSILLDLLPDPD